MLDPDIAEDVAGVPGFIVIVTVCSVLVPQSLIAFTVIFPPEVLLVALMEVDVLFPVQPFGNVHS